MLLRLRKGKRPSGGPWAASHHGLWCLLDSGGGRLRNFHPHSWNARRKCEPRLEESRTVKTAALLGPAWQATLFLSPRQHDTCPLLLEQLFSWGHSLLPSSGWVECSGKKQSSNMKTLELFPSLPLSQTPRARDPSGRRLAVCRTVPVLPAIRDWGHQFYLDYEDSPCTLRVSGEDPRGRQPAMTKDVFWLRHNERVHLKDSFRSPTQRESLWYFNSFLVH